VIWTSEVRVSSLSGEILIFFRWSVYIVDGYVKWLAFLDLAVGIST
jgi:hypothetical protein